MFANPACYLSKTTKKENCHVIGGVEKEQIQFPEGSLWSGGPGLNTVNHFGARKEAWKYLPKVRGLEYAGLI